MTIMKIVLFGRADNHVTTSPSNANPTGDKPRCAAHSISDTLLLCKRTYTREFTDGNIVQAVVPEQSIAKQSERPKAMRAHGRFRSATRRPTHVFSSWPRYADCMLGTTASSGRTRAPSLLHSIGHQMPPASHPLTARCRTHAPRAQFSLRFR